MPSRTFAPPKLWKLHTNLVANLISYSFQEKKLGIKFEMENTSQLTLIY
ncbi:hypothetical protein KCTC52924_02325 [Arenibacter antarcticus]